MTMERRRGWRDQSMGGAIFIDEAFQVDEGACPRKQSPSTWNFVHLFVTYIYIYYDFMLLQTDPEEGGFGGWLVGVVVVQHQF